MGKTIYRKSGWMVLAIICLMGIGLAGCRKASENGKLDGQWQVMSVEDFSTGEITTPAVRSYICMNLHVVHLSLTGGDLITGNMQYDKKNETLSWHFPYINEPVGMASIENWGLYSNPLTLQVVKLDGKTLILKTDRTLITCRRF